MMNQWGPALLVVLSILLAALYNNKRLDDLRSAMNGRLDDLRSEMNVRFAELQRYLDVRFKAIEDRLAKLEERPIISR